MISVRNIPSLIGRPMQNIMMGKAMAFDYSVRLGSIVLK